MQEQQSLPSIVMALAAARQQDYLPICLLSLASLSSCLHCCQLLLLLCAQSWAVIIPP
jgi:hypothetical protein